MNGIAQSVTTWASTSQTGWEMTTDKAEELATKISELANECCYRSDGYAEDIKNHVLSALHEYGRLVREQDAEVCDEASDLHANGPQFMDGAEYCAASIRDLPLP